MLAAIPAIGSILGLVFPPVMDFVKKKFLGANQDSPNATLNSLAMSKPEYVGQFVEAQAKLLEAQTKWFNRDVIGEPHKWVIDLRAAIRPITVVACVGCLIASVIWSWNVPVPIQTLMDINITSWFGSRLTK